MAALALFGAIAATSPNWASAEPPLPVTSGFSQAKLERVGDYFRNEVLSGKIPGAVVLIQQHGRPAYFERGSSSLSRPSSTSIIAATEVTGFDIE